MQRALKAIREELDERVKWFETHAKFLEAQRIKMRTEFDLEMMQEMGFCSGIEKRPEQTERVGGSGPRFFRKFCRGLRRCGTRGPGSKFFWRA